VIDPSENRGVLAEKMVAPYNAPPDTGRTPTMNGFVADCISAFTAETGRQPTYEQYAQIMSGYTPAQMPVVSSLVRGFAVFDHWFCEVPSQTFTNRSFFNAGTASGFVTNLFPSDAFPVHNTAETIFDRLEANGLSWRVYSTRPQ
jgi:phospholipase C